MRILITGANGFVGRHLVHHLLEEAEQGSLETAVLAAVSPDSLPNLLRPNPRAAPRAGWNGETTDGRLSIVALDIRDAKATAEVITQAKPDAVCHLAARASGADKDRQAVFAVNVEGTRHLLEAAALCSPFPRVLVVSTGYVYGDTRPQRPAREEDPIGPLWRYNAYTDSKIEMETVTKAYRGLAMVARPFAHTGPGQSPAFALPAFARQLARIEAGMEPPQLRVGNLEAQRDLLDVRDVVQAYGQLLRTGEVGQTYNVATGQPHTMRAMLDILRQFCRVETTVSLDPERLRPADIACSSGDPVRLRVRTDWEPRFSLEETLRDTLDYWRQQEAGSSAADPEG